MNEQDNKTGIERRRVKRREILDRFSFYICIPKLGYTRHTVNDISELGIGFMLDTLGEFRLKNDEICDFQFYLNQSLYLQLKIKVVRSMERDGAIQEVGAIFTDMNDPVHQTFVTLVKLVDQLSDTVEVHG
jgi:hypothetical protein